MSLFLLFLLALPFVLSGDDWAKGCSWVLIGIGIILIAIVALIILSALLLVGASIYESVLSLFE